MDKRMSELRAAQQVELDRLSKREKRQQKLKE